MATNIMMFLLFAEGHPKLIVPFVETRPDHEIVQVWSGLHDILNDQTMRDMMLGIHFMSSGEVMKPERLIELVTNVLPYIKTALDNKKLVPNNLN